LITKLVLMTRKL